MNMLAVRSTVKSELAFQTPKIMMRSPTSVRNDLVPAITIQDVFKSHAIHGARTNFGWVDNVSISFLRHATERCATRLCYSCRDNGVLQMRNLNLENVSLTSAHPNFDSEASQLVVSNVTLRESCEKQRRSMLDRAWR